MSPIRLTFIFFLFVFGGGAALAPVIHSFLALLGNWIPFLEEWRRDIPFRRLVNRGLIITALIGLWPFLRKLEIRNLKGIGLQRNYLRDRWSDGIGWWRQTIKGLEANWGIFSACN